MTILQAYVADSCWTFSKCVLVSNDEISVVTENSNNTILLNCSLKSQEKISHTPGGHEMSLLLIDNTFNIALL